MTPMIDVTFLLLVFFMCTLRFQTLEGKLAAHLPKDAGPNTPLQAPDLEVRVTLEVVEEGTRIPLDAEGRRFRYGPDRRLALQVDGRSFSGFHGVAKRLTELGRIDDTRRVVIDAKPGIVYSEVVQAMDGVIEAGFERVAFSGWR